jgi:hypothetical protein
MNTTTDHHRPVELKVDFAAVITDPSNSKLHAAIKAFLGVKDYYGTDSSIQHIPFQQAEYSPKRFAQESTPGGG